ncbi:MAG TPA: MEDS domain-containing protein [Acidimicrobiales bacterium]|nr:MEDS domain-containing protein [Acidimicrobiales bacterium]
MRAFGVIHSAEGSGLSDHVCWIYDDRSEFVVSAVAFLAEGLRLSQRLLYVGDLDQTRLARDLGGLGDVDALLASGQLSIASVASTYAGTSAHDWSDQHEVYASLTEAALADGYTGLRVAADATALVATTGALDAFARYEHVVDHLCANGLPFAAMCGYGAAGTGRDGADELASIHPLSHGGALPFALFAIENRRIALVGEVDALVADAFRTVLGRAMPVASTVEIDCSGLAFIDHAGLSMLDRLATSSRSCVVLDGGPAVLRRLLDLMQLRAVVAAR